MSSESKQYKLRDPIRRGKVILTDTNFETGAYGVTSKSQNPTILGQGGPMVTP